MKRIVVIGAGPKGLAIAAKCTAYRECGYDVPWVTVIDRMGSVLEVSRKHNVQA